MLQKDCQRNWFHSRDFLLCSAGSITATHDTCSSAEWTVMNDIGYNMDVLCIGWNIGYQASMDTYSEIYDVNKYRILWIIEKVYQQYFFYKPRPSK